MARARKKREFFDARQGAAVLKHALLEEYLKPFVGMTGKYAPGGRVAFVDGYAGAGAYESGDPGSPLLAVETGSQLSHIRQLECHLVERKRTTYNALCSNLGPAPNVWTYHGTIEYHVDEIMERTSGCPMFAMFDPFGLVLPMTFLEKHFLDRPRPHRDPPTEILITYVLPAVNRTMGWIKTKSDLAPIQQRRAALLDHLDATFGGAWWRDVWLEHAGSAPGVREEAVLRGYLEHLIGPDHDWAYWAVDVSHDWQSRPVYYLLFLTQHPAGIWKFHESLSLAMEKHYEFTHRNQLALESLADREAMWIREIKTNIDRLLTTKGSFRVRSEINDVFGKTLGFARGKHVRAAIKELHHEGKTRTDGVTSSKRKDPELQDQLILPP